MTSSTDTSKKNLDGDQTETCQLSQENQIQKILYFEGVPHVLIENRYRGYGGSEHVVRYWKPISNK
tara:strand:+ start:116 stop:313 length:198 start_codon:yes stop_codon:yes gene_type:complete